MPESIDIHIKNIQAKLQVLLKKHAFLEKENARLSRENEAYKANEQDLVDKVNFLQQNVHILKASAGELEGLEKKEFEKNINGYIKAIDKCIGLLNN